MSILKEIFIDKVDINPENVFSPEASDNVFEFCKQYEETIAKFGGLDITLLELGRAGALSFNEPGSQLSSTTRLMLLSKDSQNTVSKVFQTNDKGVTSAITMGISTLLNAKETFVVGWGEEVASSLKKAVEGPIDDAVPASFLQTVKHARFVVDLAAAEKLTRISKPWLVSSCEWTDQLIRRAIVWLCHVTGKPILKLTNKDYNNIIEGNLLHVKNIGWFQITEPKETGFGVNKSKEVTALSLENEFCHKYLTSFGSMGVKDDWDGGLDLYYLW